MWIRNTGLETEQLLRRQLIARGGLAAELLARPLVPKQAHDRLLLQTEMWTPEQGVDILIQRVPLHLREERKAELVRHLRVLFDLRDAQLFLYGERVEEIAAEDEGVLRGVDGVDPAWGDEESVAGFYNDAAALLHFVAEENVRLAAGQRPFFIFLRNRM